MHSTNLNKLPPTSRPFKQLKRVNNENILSANQVALVKKLDIADEKHPRDVHEKFYYYKQHLKPDTAELESYSAAICRFLATPTYVPSVHSYYNSFNEIIGVASKEHKGFKPNKIDPLRETDTIIHSHIIILEQKQLSLIKAIETTITHLDTQISNQWQLKNLIESLFSPEFTMYDYKKYLLAFLSNPNRFTATEIKQLKFQIENLLVSTTSYNELLHLKFTLSLIVELEKLTVNNKEKQVSVIELEKLNNTLIQRHIDINKLQNTIKWKDGNKVKEISVADLQNYRKVRGMATTLSTRYIFKEGDNNNANMAKDGFIIDFGWTKANILHQLNPNNIFVKLIKQPHHNTFICNEHNIRHFPDVKDTLLYYWPTKQPEVCKVMIEVIAKILEKCANLHKEDNEVILQIINNLVAKVTNNFEFKVDKSYYDQISDFVSGVFLKIKALASGQPAEELLEQQKLKEVFTLLKNRLLVLTQEYDDKINLADKKIAGFLAKYTSAFTYEDNQVFKNLSTHPVFIFHKYKIFLKYALIDKSIYHHFAKLHITPDHAFLNKHNEEKNLIDELIKDEGLRIEEVKKSLTMLPEFKQFLMQYGAYAFELIKEELQVFKTKYEQKLKQKPYYADLVKSIDLNKITKSFEALCKECAIKDNLSNLQKENNSIEILKQNSLPKFAMGKKVKNNHARLRAHTLFNDNNKKEAKELSQECRAKKARK